MIIVTGQGHHVNADGLRGVLREEIKSFIDKELKLKARVSPTNPGRLLVRIPVFSNNESLIKGEET